MTDSPANGSAANSSLERLECSLDLIYNWGYEETRRDLRDLYGKAKRSQWIPDDVIPWSIEVDVLASAPPAELMPLHGSDIDARLTPKERETMYIETNAWVLSQFLHGEQGALMAATQLVASVPDMDSKYYAATQVVDEARHVEVFDRYLHDKLQASYPVSPHLKTLLDLILKDSRWDMKLLGMQIMVEGLALASFGVMRQTMPEPLLKKLLQYVMADEARHVAYGVLSLRDYYGDLPEKERREREDFVYESAVLMRDRFLFEQVWERMGLPVKECMDITLHNQGQQMFRQFLFAKIVPAVKRLGLLTPRQRERFEALGILQFESWQDPFEALAAEEASPPS